MKAASPNSKRKKKKSTEEGCNCFNPVDHYERIRVAFDFPNWYGANWSAFWDLLWSECDADKVIIKGENTMPKELNPSLKKMHEILDRNISYCKEYNFGDFSYEIVD